MSKTIIFEFGDGTKITLTTDNDECIEKVNNFTEELADEMDTTIEMDEV